MKDAYINEDGFEFMAVKKYCPKCGNEYPEGNKQTCSFDKTRLKEYKFIHWANCGWIPEHLRQNSHYIESNGDEKK